MSNIKQVSISLSNQKGSILQIMNIIKEQQIIPYFINVGDPLDKGILRIIVNDLDKFTGSLRLESLPFQVTEIIVIEIDESSSKTSKELLEVLNNYHINIDFLTSINKTESRNQYFIRANEIDYVKGILNDHGFKTLDHLE